MKRLLRLLAALVLFIATAAQSQTYIPQLGQQSLSNSSYIIDKDGKLWAWGANESGQLGIANTTDQNMPVQVAKPLGVSGWVRIAAGERHAIAVGDSDKLYTWGYNRDGQLGVGTTNDQPSPRLVTNPSGVTSWLWVSAGEDHTVALANNGLLYAWGNNDRGQLGTGDGVSYHTPHLVPLPDDVDGWSAVAAGAGFTVAVTTHGELYIWGYDSIGDWGAPGVNPPSRLDTRFMGSAWLPDLAASSASFSALRLDGAVQTNLGRRQTQALAVAIGLDHSLILQTNGVLLAEGDNHFGQLGAADFSATTNNVAFPTGVSQWVAIAAGRRHSLALGNDGNLYAWGHNNHGQLGTSNTQSVTSPTVVRQFTESLKFSGRVKSSKDSVGAWITDTALASLIAPVGYLTLPFPITITGNPRKQFASYLLSTGDSAYCRWNITTDSSNLYTGPALGYVYLRAQGSAPRIVSFNYTITSRPHHVTIRVVDSLKLLPVANASVRIEGWKATTDSNGEARYTTGSDGITVTITRENYRSTEFVGFVGGSFDTLIDVMLVPAQVVGEWLAASRLALTKIYAIDSFTLWGFTGDSVLRSSNGGVDWKLVARTTDTINDLAFANDRVGYAVGDNGLIVQLEEPDGTAAMEPSVPTTLRLRSISTANGAVWILGDSGVLLRHVSNGWTSEVGPSHFATYIRAVNADTALIVSNSTVHERTISEWTKLPLLGGGYQDIAVIEPNLLYLSHTLALYRAPLSDSATTEFLASTNVRDARLDFLNRSIGFAYAVAGATVTYDANSFTPLVNAAPPVTSFSTVGLHTFLVSGDSIIHYTMTAGPLSAVITGRFVRPDSITGIAGGEVVLRGADGNDYRTYTTQKGYYVLTDIPLGPNQDLRLTMTDSGRTWSKHGFVTTSAGRVIRYDFIRPGSSSGVDRASEAQLRVNCPRHSRSEISFEIAGAESCCEVKVYDLLGRVVAAAADAPTAATLRGLSLVPGAYFARVTCGGRSALCSFVVE